MSKGVNKKKIVDGKFLSGIPEIDVSLKGGFLPHSLINIFGPPGAGKTTFARQLIFEGLKNGEKCIYLTTKEPIEQIKRQMKLFNWDVTPYEKDLIFIDGFSWNLPKDRRSETNYYLQNLNSLTQAYEFIKQILDKNKGKKVRFVLDTVSDFFLYSEENNVYKFLKSISALMTTGDYIGFLVLEDGLHNAKQISTIDFLCTGNLEIRALEDKRLFRIKRMEDIDHDFAWQSFEITDHGWGKVAEAFGIWQ